MRAKICIVTLGCDKNTVDAERLAALLRAAGYRTEYGLTRADAAIINTCGFIDSAKEQSIEAILAAAAAKREGLIKKLIITGCLAERYGADMPDELPEADAVVPLCFDRDIEDIVGRTLRGERVCLVSESKRTLDEGARVLSTPPHYAYLKIADGCSNHCTYCAIPAIRGGYRSRPLAAIVAEARELVRGGVRELILVAQDTTAYGRDIGSSLCELVDALRGIERLAWLRLLYAYPDGITDGLIERFSNGALLPYIDIPLQHIDDAVLKRMGRRTSRAEIEAILSRLRAAVPNIAIRTTFIAGFPAETDGQFRELLEFCRTQSFARAGCFAFSPEEGTAALRLDGQLEDGIKNERAAALSLALFGSTLDFQDVLVGQVLTVLCDGVDDETGMYICRTPYDAPDIDCVVLAPSRERMKAGEFYAVEIISHEGTELACRRLDNRLRRI